MEKTLDKYKDSGIAWIGEIPSEWKIVRIKDEYSFQTGATPPTGNESFFDGNNIWVSIADMKDRIVYDSKKKLSDSGIQKCSMSIVPMGSLLYSFKLSVGNVAFAGTDLYTNEAIASFSPNCGYLPFLYYTAPQFIIFNANTNIYGANILNQELIKNAFVPLPPLSEQQRIATFLDKKCRDIDSLISLQEEMITELQAYKQSVITEAVTKGLNPNVQFIDSQEEWLGEIPSDWELLPIRALFTKRNKKNDPIISKERLSLSIGIGITRYADKTTNLDRFKEDFTAYQLAYPDDIVLNSMNMIVGAVGKSAFMGCVSPVYYVITAKEGVDPNFYAYLLNSPKIREVYHSLGRGIYAIERGEGRVNTCRLKVPYYDFSIIKVPVPSYEEQIKIATHLDEKTQQIDSLIALKQDKIAELKDYKKSVIYEYVTGKKRV